jgi:hypothetical protein
MRTHVPKIKFKSEMRAYYYAQGLSREDCCWQARVSAGMCGAQVKVKLGIGFDLMEAYYQICKTNDIFWNSAINDIGIPSVPSP